MGGTTEPTTRSADQRSRFWLFALIGGGGLVISFATAFGLLTPPSGLSAEGFMVFGIMLTMAAAWILEAMPFAATALLPLVLLPLLGISGAKIVAKSYANSTILLFMGGFFLAKGLERWQVPQVIARRVERLTSGSPMTLLFGISGITALLSMWLSNTATTLIMVTVAEAALQRARQVPSNRAVDLERYRLALLLGVAYSANLGGMATPVGTAPNLLFLSMRKELEPSEPAISFVEWMVLTLPFVLVMVPLITFLLAKVLSPFSRELRLGTEDQEGTHRLSNTGRNALLIFAVTVALWVWRADLDLGVVTLPGWAGLLGLQNSVDDSTVAILGATFMFLWPVSHSDLPPSQSRDLPPGPTAWLQRERILTWDVANQIPWYLLLLFGGGLALADAFSSTGLSAWLGQQLVGLQGAPTWLLVVILCLGMSLLTEVTSNTATTTLILPVLFAAAPALGLPPILLMWPATLCASAAFILPVSTPPNAIVAGAGPIRPMEMAKVGIWCNLLAVLLVTLLTLFWLVPRMGMG